MVNGYVTLDLASNKIYKESLGAIKSGKPVMVVDAPQVYFADTISIVSDDVVITKGGKTITINDANAVSSVGDMVNHLYRHEIMCDDSNFYLVGVIYTTFATKITKDNITTLITNYEKIPMNAYNGDANKKIVSATLNIQGDIFKIGGLYVNDDNAIDSADDILIELAITFEDFVDTVTQLI